MADEIRPRPDHIPVLRNREELTVTGVENVDSYNDNIIEAVTALGAMTVEGRELHITKLSLESGEMHVTGNISGVLYAIEPEKPEGGFFRRLFK